MGYCYSFCHCAGGGLSFCVVSRALSQPQAAGQVIYLLLLIRLMFVGLHGTIWLLSLVLLFSSLWLTLFCFMVKLFFMVVYYSLFRWFVQSDIVDCINSCSRLYSPLPESVVVNCMIRVSYKEKRP